MMKTTLYAKCGFEPPYVQKIYGVGAWKCGFSPCESFDCSSILQLREQEQEKKELESKFFCNNDKI
jgi:hypothetical protein